MTNEQILTKAIEKAIAGGWKVHTHKPIDFGVREDLVSLIEVPELVEIITEKEIISEPTDTYAYSKNDLLFNKQFAQALWGEKQIWWGHENAPEARHEIPAFQYHLQQMVIADDPLEYLRENI